VAFFRPSSEDAGERRSEALPETGHPEIPPSAESRLRALSATGQLFTSGLSVKEFALLDRLGPQPLAQVMGASVVRRGWQYLPALNPGQGFAAWASAQPRAWGPSYPAVYGSTLRNPFTEPSMAQVRAYRWHTEVVCVLDVLTAAWNLARAQALDRLAEEARQVKADAVVGVHVRRSDHDLGAKAISFVVTGTAIRLPGSSGGSNPQLSDLSAQDYWRLLKAGHEPVGLLATTSAVFASPPRSTRLRRARAITQNQELSEISAAFQLAREQVRAGLRGQVADARGTGAVGIEFSHSVHREKLELASSLQSQDRRGWHRGRFGIPYLVSGHGETERRGWVITMHAAGTAVRPSEVRPPHEIKTAMRLEGP
jgi:hypothetical protein